MRFSVDLSAAAQTTPSSTSLTTTQSQTQSQTRATVTHQSTTTGADGSASTVTQVETIVPTATGLGAAQATHVSHSNSNLGLIIGVALGVPLVLIIAAIAIFMLCRRKRKTKDYSNIFTRPASPPAMANYANIPPGTHAPEIAGYPVADTRSKDERTSELYGSDRYIYSPSVSPLTNKSSPPLYSPNGTKNPAMQTRSPTMAQIQEEPQELWGGYVPYRPPANAELPTEKSENLNPISPL